MRKRRSWSRHGTLPTCWPIAPSARSKRSAGKLSKQERLTLETQILDLRSALVGDDLAILRERTAALRTALLKTGERVYHEPEAEPAAGAEQPATKDAAARRAVRPDRGRPTCRGRPMSTTKRDYYEVLGVPRSATEDEIKRAYRQPGPPLPSRH